MNGLYVEKVVTLHHEINKQLEIKNKLIMKKIISMALAAVIAISASAKSSLESDNISLVKVNAPVHLVITKAPFTSVKVMSRNKQLASTVSYTIKDGVLRINANDLESIENSKASVTVVVSAPGNVSYQMGNDMVVAAENTVKVKPFPFHHRRMHR